MDEHDQYESVGLDDSLEDERDLDQIMADRRAAEIELDTREGVASRAKLPHLLNDQGQLGFLILCCFISRPFNNKVLSLKSPSLLFVSGLRVVMIYF